LKSIACTTIVVALIVFSGSAAAASIPIQNANFASPNLGGASGTEFAAGSTGWTGFLSTVNNQYFIANGIPYGFPSTPNGDQLGFVGLGFSGGDYFYQTLSASLTADTTYTLSFWVGNPVGGFGFDGYQAELLAGSTILAVDTTGVTPAVGSFLLDTFSWDSATATPTQLAAIGQPLRIQFLQGVPSNESGTVAFTDITLDGTSDTAQTSGVPEPSAWMLVLFGSASLGAADSLRKRARNARFD
jgi:hypothetical protein